MLHLITAENRSVYEEELVKLHRARKSIFVDEMGWKLNVKDGLEYDEYDDDQSMCVVGFDVDGDVAMSARFRPTANGSMMMDHFAHVVPPDVRPVNESQTWEISRGLSREIGQKRHNLMRKAACMLTPLEVALANGVDRYVGFSDIRAFSYFLNMGWNMRMFGDPVAYGEGDGVAYEIEVSEQAISAMRKTWGLPDPSYVYIRQEDLQGRTLQQHVQWIAATKPEYAQLMPVREVMTARKRAQKDHQARYSSARLKALARLQRSRQNINRNEGIST